MATDRSWGISHGHCGAVSIGRRYSGRTDAEHRGSFTGHFHTHIAGQVLTGHGECLAVGGVVGGRKRERGLAQRQFGISRLKQGYALQIAPRAFGSRGAGGVNGLNLEVVGGSGCQSGHVIGLGRNARHGEAIVVGITGFARLSGRVAAHRRPAIELRQAHGGGRIAGIIQESRTVGIVENATIRVEFNSGITADNRHRCRRSGLIGSHFLGHICFQVLAVETRQEFPSVSARADCEHVHIVARNYLAIGDIHCHRRHIIVAPEPAGRRLGGLVHEYHLVALRECAGIGHLGIDVSAYFGLLVHIEGVTLHCLGRCVIGPRGRETRRGHSRCRLHHRRRSGDWGQSGRSGQRHGHRVGSCTGKGQRGCVSTCRSGLIRDCERRFALTATVASDCLRAGEHSGICSGYGSRNVCGKVFVEHGHIHCALLAYIGRHRGGFVGEYHRCVQAGIVCGGHRLHSAPVAG